MSAFKKAGGEYSVGGETLTRIKFSYEIFEANNKKIKEEANDNVAKHQEIIRSRIQTSDFNNDFIEKIKAMNPIIEDTTINKPAKNLFLSLVDMEALRSEFRSKTKKIVEKNDLDKDAML